IVAGICGNPVVDTPEEAQVIVDDIIDSGKTRDHYKQRFPTKPFWALVDKTDSVGQYAGIWVQFPWEMEADRDVEDNVVRLLQFLGEDAGRPGLVGTPARVVKALKEMTAGYAENPEDILAREFPGDG